MKFEPIYYKENLKIIDPEGTVGIITLWTKPIIIENLLKEKCPQLFANSSGVVTISSLYGNGFSQLMANLAFNPQINKIAVIGEDLPISRTYTYLQNFLNLGVEKEIISGIEVSRIKETNLLIDSQLDPKMFSYLTLRRFKEDELDKLLDFVNEGKINENNRVKIEITFPKFNDFPSELTNHNLIAKTPIEAWMDVLYHLNKFGKNIQIVKGIRRALFNLDVTIEDPSFEDEEILKEFNFNPEDLRKYQREILEPELSDSLTYSYGNRIRKYWGEDSLSKIIEMLKQDPTNRHCLISLWDTSKDLLKRESSPCLTDLYFVKEPNGKLMLSASFRTHNAVSAWLPNIYGLKSILDKVARETGIEPGKINVRSRWIGIDPDDQKTKFLLKLVEEKRNIKLDVNDPKGYFTFNADKETNELVVLHYSSEGFILDEIRGKTLSEVKNKMRQKDAFSTYDHAVFFGIELARIQKELSGDIPII